MANKDVYITPFII